MSKDAIATPRIASGGLFVDDDRVVLVRKTYGCKWDLPGGYVEPGESPAQACEREIREELGLSRTAERLLVHDWAPNDHGDKILYVFGCGSLGEDETRIQLQADELDRWAWVPVSQLEDFVIPRLVRRITQAHKAFTDGNTRYLERGEPVLKAVR